MDGERFFDIHVGRERAPSVRDGSFLPAAVLHGQVDEPRGLNYFETPISVTKAPTADGNMLYHADTDHRPLSGDQLFTLLFSVAPNPGNDSIPGVIADWNVIERAKQESSQRRYQSYLKDLVSLHKRLGEPWVEFMKSRGDYLQAFEESQPPYFGPNRVPYWMRPGPRQPQDAQEAALNLIATSFDAAADYLQQHGVPDGRQQLLRQIQQAINSRRHKSRQLTNEQRIVLAAKKADMVRYMGRLLPSEELQALEPMAFATFTPGNGQIYSYHRNEYDPEVLAEDFANRQVVERNGFRAEVVTLSRPSLHERYGSFVVPGSIERSAPLGTLLQPRITWTKDRQGNRKFVFERSTTPDGVVHYDGVLGALAVAYFSPAIIEKWPKTMKIGGGRSQEMGVAQVPVLALFPKYQQELLNSDFIAAAEAVT